MAISINPSTQEPQKKSSFLEITTKDYYFDSLRPYMQGMLSACRTDPELIRTLEKTVNRCDSFAAVLEDPNHKSERRENLQGLLDTNAIFNNVLNSPSYFGSGTSMSRASEREKEIIRNFLVKVRDFEAIIKSDLVSIPDGAEEKKEPERLEYSKEERMNSDVEHNMVNLTKPNAKKRLPN